MKDFTLNWPLIGALLLNFLLWSGLFYVASRMGG